jgi:predicted nucleic acid-binding protein
MNALVDTNILVRLSDSGHPVQPVCQLALQRLLQRQDRVFLCAQTASDFFPGNLGEGRAGGLPILN